MNCNECGKNIEAVKIIYGKYTCPHCRFEYFIENYKNMPSGLILSGTVFGPSIFETVLGTYKQMERIFVDTQKRRKEKDPWIEKTRNADKFE